MQPLNEPKTAPKQPAGGRRYWLILPLLFVAATVAVVLMDTQRSVELAIPVTVTNLDSDLIMADTPRPTVRLRVSGSSSSLDAIDAGQPACRIDLTGLAAGIHTLPVKPADLTLPKGITLDTLLTPTIMVALAPVVRKTVGVVAVLSGTPAPGFAVTRVVLKPDRLVLCGTADMLADIETVRTHPIDLEGAAESFKKEVPLNLADAIAVEPSLRIVIADVSIQERIVTRVLENIPVTGLPDAVDAQISPATITLTVSGPEAVVNAVENRLDFSVTIDLNDLSPGTYSLNAAIHLPVQVSLDQVSPEQFSVTIK
jgi:YbbR domain-containing protein